MVTVGKLFCDLTDLHYLVFTRFLTKVFLKPQTELRTSGCIRERDVSLTHGDLPSVKSKQIQPTGGRSIVTVIGTGAQIYRGSLCLDS